MAATLSRQLVLSADGFFILGTRGLHPVPPRGPSTPRSLHPRQLELARWEQGLEDRRPGQLGTKAPVPGASETRRGRPLPPRGRAVTRAVSRTLPSAPAPGGRCGSSWPASGCWRREGNGAHAAPQAWRDFRHTTLPSPEASRSACPLSCPYLFRAVEGSRGAVELSRKTPRPFGAVTDRRPRPPGSRPKAGPESLLFVPKLLKCFLSTEASDEEATRFHTSSSFFR